MDFLSFAKYYNNLGVNISYVKNDEEIEFNGYLKSPNDDFLKFTNTKQTVEYLEKIDWCNVSGIGCILGYNDLICIDIDNCFDKLIIDDILRLLKLPSDYHWVISSGSNMGYHILVKLPFPDITVSSFFKYDEYYQACSSKIEIKDNILLTDQFVLNVLGENYNYIRTINFDKDEFNFILNRNSNVVSLNTNNLVSNYIEKIDFLWHKHSLLPPSLHKSGFRYSYIYNDLPVYEPIKINIDDFLIMVAVLCYEVNNYNKFEANYGSIFLEKDITKFNNLTINDSILKDYKKDDLYIVIDTETNNLANIKLPFYDSDTKIIQLAWLITDGKKILIKESSLIKYDNIVIDEYVQKITGIDIELINKVGRPLDKVLDLFLSHLSYVANIIGHNLEYDLHVLKTAFFNIHLPFNILNLKEFCTMKLAYDLKEKIPKYTENKWLKLDELYSKYFKDVQNKQHNATVDSIMTYRIFKKLQEINT
jgi:DNA polymerase III epsilon subunit-like protein